MKASRKARPARWNEQYSRAYADEHYPSLMNELPRSGSVSLADTQQVLNAIGRHERAYDWAAQFDQIAAHNDHHINERLRDQDYYRDHQAPLAETKSWALRCLICLLITAASLIVAGCTTLPPVVNIPVVSVGVFTGFAAMVISIEIALAWSLDGDEARKYQHGRVRLQEPLAIWMPPPTQLLLKAVTEPGGPLLAELRHTSSTGDETVWQFALGRDEDVAILSERFSHVLAEVEGLTTIADECYERYAQTLGLVDEGLVAAQVELQEQLHARQTKDSDNRMLAQTLSAAVVAPE